MGDRQGHPPCPVEHLMVEGEVRVVGVAGEAQGGGDGAAPSGEVGADEQDQRLAPGRVGKAWLKVGQDRYNGQRKGHGGLPVGDRALVSFYLTTSAGLFLPWPPIGLEMYKVELSGSG